MRSYRRNEAFRLEAPRPGPARETRSIAGLTTLGLIINPKTKEPVLATTDGEYVSIRSLRQESLLRKLGTGYHSTSREPSADATDYPRVHTPEGVKVRGMGYGTALYSALCDGAHLRYREHVEISMKKKGDGISSDTSDRSTEADHWWSAALKQGLTEEHREESEEVDEGVDVDVAPSELRDCVSVREGEITYVNSVNVDITKTTETVFDTYSYESLTDHHLVAAEIVLTLPGVLTDETDLYVLWQSALEDPDIS